MRRLPLNLVKEMFFTGTPVKAADAANWGILNHLVLAAELETFTDDINVIQAIYHIFVSQSLRKTLRSPAQNFSHVPFMTMLMTLP